MTSNAINSSVGTIERLDAQAIIDSAVRPEATFGRERSELRLVIDQLAPGEGVVLPAVTLASMLGPGKSSLIDRARGVARSRELELRKAGIDSSWAVRKMPSGAIGIARTS